MSVYGNQINLELQVGQIVCIEVSHKIVEFSLVVGTAYITSDMLVGKGSAKREHIAGKSHIAIVCTANSTGDVIHFKTKDTGKLISGGFASVHHVDALAAKIHQFVGLNSLSFCVR